MYPELEKNPTLPFCFGNCSYIPDWRTRIHWNIGLAFSIHPEYVGMNGKLPEQHFKILLFFNPRDKIIIRARILECDINKTHTRTYIYFLNIDIHLGTLSVLQWMGRLSTERCVIQNNGIISILACIMCGLLKAYNKRLFLALDLFSSPERNTH